MGQQQSQLQQHMEHLSQPQPAMHDYVSLAASGAVEHAYARAERAAHQMGFAKRCGAHDVPRRQSTLPQAQSPPPSQPQHAAWSAGAGGEVAAGVGLTSERAERRRSTRVIIMNIIGPSVVLLDQAAREAKEQSLRGITGEAPKRGLGTSGGSAAAAAGAGAGVNRRLAMAVVPPGVGAGVGAARAARHRTRLPRLQSIADVDDE